MPKIGDNYPTSDYDPTLDESEIAELGLSHQIISDELYLPSHPSRDWIRCYVSTTGPGCYRLFLEGKKRVRFLMSAKRFEGKDSSFYISTNEDFPGLESIPPRGYIARLDRTDDKSFLLTLNQCHLCDKMLGYFHCGRGELEREVIAKITHYFKYYRPCNAEYRYFNIHIPFISKYGKRKIWCPRAFRRSNANLLNDVTVSEAVKRDDKCALVLKSKPPSYNAELQSLVVKFHGNRVLIPSIKNFLLYASSECSVSHDKEGEAEDSELDEAEEEELVFQLDEPSTPHLRPKPHQNPLPSPSVRRIASVTEIPRIISTLRQRAESSIESPMRKTSRGKSLSTASTSPSASPNVQQNKSTTSITSTTTSSATVSASIATSLSSVGSDCNLSTSVNNGNSNSLGSRYASMFNYSFPSSSMDCEDSYINSEISVSIASREGNNNSSSKKHQAPAASPGHNHSRKLTLDTSDLASTTRSNSSTSNTASNNGNTNNTNSNYAGQLKKIRQAYAEKYSVLADENEALLQFGKASPTRFILDFKYPFSPLQAFGIALSVFADDLLVSPYAANSPYVAQSRKTMR